MAEIKAVIRTEEEAAKAAAQRRTGQERHAEIIERDAMLGELGAMTAAC